MTLFQELLNRPDLFEHRADPKVVALVELLKTMAANSVMQGINPAQIMYDGNRWTIKGRPLRSAFVDDFIVAVSAQAEFFRDDVLGAMLQYEGWGGSEGIVLRQFNRVNNFVNDVVTATKTAYCEIELGYPSVN